MKPPRSVWVAPCVARVGIYYTSTAIAEEGGWRPGALIRYDLHRPAKAKPRKRRKGAK